MMKIVLDPAIKSDIRSWLVKITFEVFAGFGVTFFVWSVLEMIGFPPLNVWQLALLTLFMRPVKLTMRNKHGDMLPDSWVSVLITRKPVLENNSRHTQLSPKLYV